MYFIDTITIASLYMYNKDTTIAHVYNKGTTIAHVYP